MYDSRPALKALLTLPADCEYCSGDFMLCEFMYVYVHVTDGGGGGVFKKATVATLRHPRPPVFDFLHF